LYYWGAEASKTVVAGFPTRIVEFTVPERVPSGVDFEVYGRLEYEVEPVVWEPLPGMAVRVWCVSRGQGIVWEHYPVTDAEGYFMVVESLEVPREYAIHSHFQGYDGYGMSDVYVRVVTVPVLSVRLLVEGQPLEGGNVCVAEPVIVVSPPIWASKTDVEGWAYFDVEVGRWYMLGQMYDGATDYLIINGQLIPVDLPSAVPTRAVADPRVAIGYNYHDVDYTDKCDVALAYIYDRALSPREGRALCLGLI